MMLKVASFVWLLSLVAVILEGSGVSAQVPVSTMLGTYESPCYSLGDFLYFNSDLVISAGGTRLYYTWNVYLFSCELLALRLTVNADIVQSQLVFNGTYVDLPITGLTATVYSNAVEGTLNSACPRPGGWHAGQTYNVTDGCSVGGLYIPGTNQCAGFYTTFQYAFYEAETPPTAVLWTAPLWEDDNGTAECSLAQRHTWITKDRPYSLVPGQDPSLNQYRCVALPNSSVCHGAIDYNVELIPGQTMDALEADIYAFATPFVWSVITSGDTCRAAIGQLMCSKVFHRCAAPSNVPCKTTCTNVTNLCPPSDISNFNTLLGLIPGQMPNYGTLCTADDTPATCAPRPRTPVPAYAAANFGGAVLPYPTCQAFPTDPDQPCAGVVDYSVYVPAGESMATLTAQARTKFYFIFSLAPRDGCFETLARYACSQVFLKCTTGVVAGVTPGVPFPQLPCRSLCDNYAHNCSAFIPTDARLAPNCSAVGFYVKGQPDFPRTHTDFPLGLVSPCSAGSAAATLTPQYECNFPTVKPDDPNAPTLNGGGCAFACKVPFFDHDDYVSQDTAIRVLSPFHCLGVAFTAFTLAFFTEKRNRRPQNYLLHFNLVLIPVTITIMIGLASASPHDTHKGYGVHSLQCKDNTQQYTQGEDALCDAQGFTTAFSLTGATCFMLAYCVELFLTMTFMTSKISEKYLNYTEYFWYAFSYASAFAWPIASFANNHVFGDATLPWCDNETTPTGKNMWRFMASLHIISAVILLICVGLILRMCYATRRVTGAKTNIYLRPLAFLIVFTSVFIYSAGYHFYIWDKEDEWRGNVEEWVLCWMVLLPSGAVSECASRPDVAGKGHWRAVMNVLVLLGFVSFLLVGLTVRNITAWQISCTTRFPALRGWLCCRKCYREGGSTLHSTGEHEGDEGSGKGSGKVPKSPSGRGLNRAASGHSGSPKGSKQRAKPLLFDKEPEVRSEASVAASVVVMHPQFEQEQSPEIPLHTLDGKGAAAPPSAKAFFGGGSSSATSSPQSSHFRIEQSVNNPDDSRY